MSVVLHDKYRPETWDEVVGQDIVVNALATAVRKRSYHSFLLSGPSGCGKTTLARIAAREAGSFPNDILEIDAATFTGIDEMRRVQDLVQYQSFSPTGVRATIVDECHALSRQAWESLLKVIEEPPKHAFWFFCTTNPAKVPNTIKTRCMPLIIKSLTDKEILQVIINVSKEDKNLKLPTGVIDTIIDASNGSARQALVFLEMCRGVDEATAKKLTQQVVETEPVLELCRFFMKGGSWAKAMSIFAKLEGEAPESVRIQVCRYLASTLKNAKSEREAVFLLQLLDAFSTPFNQTEGHAPLFLAIGKSLFNREED